MLEQYNNNYVLDEFPYEGETYYKAEVGVKTVPNHFTEDDWEWQYEYLKLVNEDFDKVKHIKNPEFTLFNKKQADYIDNKFYNDYIDWVHYTQDDNPYDDYNLGDFS